MTGEPLPQFSVDPVVDFCVKEAITIRASQARAQADKDQKRKAWKKDTEHLESAG